MVSVIPQPVYMNSSDAVRMKVTGVSEMHDDDDLKTPTVEELAFPGHKAVSITRQNEVLLGYLYRARLKDRPQVS